MEILIIWRFKWCSWESICLVSRSAPQCCGKPCFTRLGSVPRALISGSGCCRPISMKLRTVKLSLRILCLLWCSLSANQQWILISCTSSVCFESPQFVAHCFPKNLAPIHQLKYDPLFLPQLGRAHHQQLVYHPHLSEVFLPNLSVVIQRFLKVLALRLPLRHFLLLIRWHDYFPRRWRS